jgi:hypothetical protein
VKAITGATTRQVIAWDEEESPSPQQPTPLLSLETALLAVGVGSGTNREECLNPRESAVIRGYRPGAAAANPYGKVLQIATF